MSELTKICPTSEVAEGSVKSFEVGNNVIAVYNVGGDVLRHRQRVHPRRGEPRRRHPRGRHHRVHAALRRLQREDRRGGAGAVLHAAADLQGGGAGRPGDGRPRQDRGGLGPCHAPTVASLFARGVARGDVGARCRAGLSDPSDHLVLPFPAGSGIDVTARLVADNLRRGSVSRSWSRTRPAPTACWRRPRSPAPRPTATRIFMTTNSSQSAAPFLLKSIPYDPVKDFAPICGMGNLPFIMVIGTSGPGQELRRVRGLRQGQSRQAELRQQQLHRHCRRRDGVAARGHPAHPRALQVRAAGDAGSAARRNLDDVRRFPERPAACHNRARSARSR